MCRHKDENVYFVVFLDAAPIVSAASASPIWYRLMGRSLHFGRISGSYRRSTFSVSLSKQFKECRLNHATREGTGRKMSALTCQMLRTPLLMCIVLCCRSTVLGTIPA